MTVQRQYGLETTAQFGSLLRCAVQKWTGPNLTAPGVRTGQDGRDRKDYDAFLYEAMSARMAKTV